jgi:hypothetical protein
VQALIAIPAFFGLCILAMLWGSINRELFGDYHGTIAATSQLLFTVALVVCGRIILSGRRRLGFLLLGYSTALLCALLAWFVHPDQVIDRAFKRADEYRTAISELRIAVRERTAELPSPGTFPRLYAELRARELELDAALERYNEPAHAKEAKMYTYLLSALSAILLFGSLVVQRATLHSRSVA